MSTTTLDIGSRRVTLRQWIDTAWADLHDTDTES